jgi:hypothetical protein
MTSIRLGFLDSARFGAKSPNSAYWIVLDFLGFSRPNLDLSMGCEGFLAESFSCASWRERPERAPAVEVIREGGIVHEATLLQFLIVSNQLSELADLFSRPRMGRQW